MTQRDRNKDLFHALPLPVRIALDASAKMDERPDIYSHTGISWQVASGAQERSMANLTLIKATYLRAMDVPDNLGPLAQLGLAVGDLRRKSALIKISLAVKNTLAKLHDSSSTALLLSAHIPLVSSKTFAGEPLRLEDAVTLEMLSVLCFLTFSAFQPGPGTQWPAYQGQKNEYQLHAARQLTEDPTLFEPTASSEHFVAGWGILREASHNSQSQSQSQTTQEGRMHARWLDHDMLIVMMHMFLLTLPTTLSKDTIEESWVRTAFGDLLSNIDVSLQVRIANAISLQNKMLSLLTAALTTFSGSLLHWWSTS